MGFDLLTSIRPILELMPNVPRPTKVVPIKKRLFYTFASLALYLACTLIPLYGCRKMTNDDPMYHLRLITASSRFTLMELGISPIITSSMILQFFVSFGLIKHDPSDQVSSALYDAAQKLAALVFTAFQAGSNIFSGEYGIRGEMSVIDSLLIMVQLMMSAIVVILLDELCQNGYGIGSGISLFICTNVSEQIVWRLFSFNHYNFGRGVEYEGAVIALFHLLITRKNKLRALREAVFRSHLPNVASIFSTVIIFIAVIFFEHIKINIGLETTVSRQQPQPFEIKLLYQSTTPIIIQSTLVQQLTMFSRTIYFRWPESTATQILGVWRSQSNVGDEYARPVSGLIYYLQAPQNITETIMDPVHTLVYMAFSLISAGFLAYWYLQMGGNGPKEIAKSLKRQHLTIKGHRDDQTRLEKTLNRYIPTAAALGGVLTALLSIVADMLGAFGSGTGILICVSIINQFTQELSKEAAENGFLGLLKGF